MGAQSGRDFWRNHRGKIGQRPDSYSTNLGRANRELDRLNGPEVIGQVFVRDVGVRHVEIAFVTPARAP